MKFLSLLEKVTNGSVIEISYTGMIKVYFKRIKKKKTNFLKFLDKVPHSFIDLELLKVDVFNMIAVLIEVSVISWNL